jgi:glycine/D-amino acid oxidase-like deaminating enzyme
VSAFNRRRLLQAAGSAIAFAPLVARAADAPAQAPALAWPDRLPPLAPIRAHTDRLFDITVCLRPFRAQGPRIEAEHIGHALVVHNYGHGGSGWSLSWGSGTLALRLAMERNPNEIAVIGCGAIGLTTAILALEAGLKVTIYAKDLLPDTRSARATGSFTPDSRIALTDKAAPDFGDRWEEMARISFHRYRRYLGLPGTPVEWNDRYYLSDHAPDEPQPPDPPGTLDFASYGDRIADLVPHSQQLPPEQTPFPVRNVRRGSTMMFNIADYGHTLMQDFLIGGGNIVRREFHSLAELGHLPQKVIINCPGYGARALCQDESVVPVRGQIGWLVPQPEVTYGIAYRGVLALSRKDGICIQVLTGGDMRGYADDNETINRTESEDGVNVIADLCSRFRAQP